MIGAYVFGGLSIILCLLFCWFRSEKANVYSLVLKISASLCFVLGAIFALNSVSSMGFGLLIICGCSSKTVLFLRLIQLTV